MRRIWLASYPKSGNTWMRMMVSALALKDGETLDINNLPDRSGIVSAREGFDNLSLIDSELLTHDETVALRPLVHGAQTEGPGADTAERKAAVRYVKAHDAYTYLPDGTPLLAGRAGAQGAVLIVRDPRDVAPSFANHNDDNVDKAIDRMADPGDCFCGRTDRLVNQLRQRLLGWSRFNASWLDQRDLPVLLVRYEDMIADPAAILTQVVAFAGSAPEPDKIARAVALADFAEMTAQESTTGFWESPRRTKEGRFFRRGKAGAWRDELTAEQIARIESDHASMMQRLGYDLSDAKMRRMGMTA